MFRVSLATAIAAIASAKDGSEFNGSTYIRQTRQQKSDQIWTKVTENTTSGWWNLQGALLVDENTVFDTLGDELPCFFTGCRNKTIHSQGVVAKAVWHDVGGHPFTGMFKGADAGYVRFSVAKPVNPIWPNMAPGMGVKLLRDGADSANFVAMYSVDGQDDLNFFANDFVNHIEAAKFKGLRPLEQHFASATQFIQTVGLSEMASITQEGQIEPSPAFPWSLRFHPTGQFDFPSTSAEGYKDYKSDLASIPKASVLYEVYAMDEPAELGGTERMIAKLVAASEFTTSNWGDEHMYFRHQRMDDDLKIRPDWEPYTPRYGGFFSLEQEQELANKNQLGGCPWKNLLQ